MKIDNGAVLNVYKVHMCLWIQVRMIKRMKMWSWVSPDYSVQSACKQSAGASSVAA